MSPPLELDYIGLSPPPPAAAPPAHAADDLKGTELRLGLPGSHSPDRRAAAAAAAVATSGAATLDLLPTKGAKRGFSDEAPPPPSAAAAAVAAAVAAAAGKGKKVAEDEEEEEGDDGKKVAATPQPAAKAQVVGWPPIRSYRKNTMATNQLKNSKEEADDKQSQGGFLYVKVSMDGAPYLRKVDLKIYKNYKDLSTALEKMFIGFTTGKDLSESRKDGEYVLTYEDKDGDWMLVGDVPWGMFANSCRRLRIMKGSDAIGLAPRAGDKSKNRN